MKTLKQKEEAKARIRTPRGLLRRIYTQQKSNSKTRGHNPPAYNIDDFVEWALNLDNFFSIYSVWWLSNYPKKLRPSFDRVDNSKGYSFDNIQLMTWDENNKRQNNDVKIGVDNSCNIAVLQYDLDGNFIAEFHSMHDAARKTNSCFKKVSLVCNGLRKTHNKFIWKLK